MTGVCKFDSGAWHSSLRCVAVPGLLPIAPDRVGDSADIWTRAFRMGKCKRRAIVLECQCRRSALS